MPAGGRFSCINVLVTQTSTKTKIIVPWGWVGVKSMQSLDNRKTLATR